LTEDDTATHAPKFEQGKQRDIVNGQTNLRTPTCITVCGEWCAWLGIPIFGSFFWDPHRKRNSNSMLDSKDSGRDFFVEIPMSGESENWNSDLQYSEFQ
jgi:hypothetical protein